MVDLDLCEGDASSVNLAKLVDNAIKIFKQNSPEILTALGVVGVAATAAYSAKAGYQTAEAFAHSPSTPPKERVKQTWTGYLPAAICGAGTIACFIAAGRGQSARTAAAITAYSVTEKAFSEYREKMIEEVGARKDQKVQDAVAQKNVLENPPPASNQLIVLGRDESLFCELQTGRYFRSSMEDLISARNSVNHWLVTSRYVTLGSFYDLIGLPQTDVSSKMGWDDDKGLLDLEFSAVITEDKRPCIAFRYNYCDPLN